VLSIGVITALIGLACMFAYNAVRLAFFRGDTLREGFSITEDDRVGTGDKPGARRPRGDRLTQRPPTWPSTPRPAAGAGRHR